MQITLRPLHTIALVALIALLLGFAIGQVASAGASDPVASQSSTYPILRELQDINATLGPDTGGSIEPILRQIEKFTYNACRAIENHPYGHCS